MNQIEKDFYQIFRISLCNRMHTLKDCPDLECDECKYFTAEISPSRILKLICLCSWYELYLFQCCDDNIKDIVLKKTITQYNTFRNEELREYFRAEVQQIFKGVK